MGLAVSLVFAGIGYASSMNLSVSFSMVDLSFSELRFYDLVRVDGCDLHAEPGHPLLPQKLLNIAIPAGSKVRSLRVTSVETAEIKGEYDIYPAQPEVPISLSGNDTWVSQDEKIYHSRNLHPGVVAELTGQGSFSGHWIAQIAVHPVRYRPAENRLVLHTRIEFELELEHSERALKVKVRSPGSEKLVSDAVKSIVMNPEGVGERVVEGSHRLDTGEVEYLIVTSPSLAGEFQRIADWKTMKGVPAEVITTDSIYAYYFGLDNAERVRACIIDYYTNRGLVWVLLGGDVNVVPYRGCYGRVGGYTDNNMPCDLYFSDLDGDFDFDKDGIWGELSDSVDLYPDVFVGRAPVSSAVECSIVVRKMLLYEGVLDGTPIPCDYQLKMVFLAEWLDGITDAGLGKNMIDDAYVPPRYDPISKLYESLNNLNKQAAVDSMNTGYAIVNHSGHSNYGVMSVGPNALTRTDMYGLTNDTRFTLCYSIGCIAGGFENNDCIGEKFVLAPNGGGYFVGNSRYGWYSPGNPGGGTSEKYDQMFFACLYDETNARLGMAHSVAKTYYIGWSGNYNAYRWVQFCLNALGEPENFIWTDIPRSLSPLYASTIPENAVQLDVRVLAGGQPVESALVCLLKDGEVYLRELTDSNGEVTFALSDLTPGLLNVTITGHNYLPHRGQIEILPAPDIPVLLSPLDGVISGNTRPTMVWSSTVGPGGSHTLEYSTSEDFSSDVVSIPGLTTTNYTIPDTASLLDAVYFWHVQAVDVNGFPSGYQDQPWQYTVDTTPPEFSDTYQWPDTTFRGPYYVETLISDNSGILAAYLAYRTDQDTVWRFEEMDLQGPYYAYIPEQSCGVTVDYYVYAADISDPPNTGSDPSNAPESTYSFTVLEPTGVDIVNPAAVPASLFLNTSPNPVRSWVRLDCGLPRESNLRIEVFDSCGRLIKTITDGRFLAGSYTIKWDGRSHRGEMMPSGIYYARLSTDLETLVSKVVIVK